MDRASSEAVSTLGALPANEEQIKRVHYWPCTLGIESEVASGSGDGPVVGFIGSERVYHGLRHECDLVLLTPANYTRMLSSLSLDFVLVESCRETVTGHWYLAQTLDVDSRETLTALLAESRRLGIPTVYWHTEDLAYWEHYADFATGFDALYCADPRVAARFEADGVSAQVLLPAAQPRIHNGFRQSREVGSLSIPILFDGLGDIIRHGDALQVLLPLRERGLKIIDSRNQIYRTKVQTLTDYEGCVLGCVTRQGRLGALKYADSCVALETTLATRTAAEWQAVETASCRLATAYLGAADRDSMRGALYTVCKDDGALLDQIDAWQSDWLERDIAAHLAWRRVHESHGYVHRLSTICADLGVAFPWEAYPRASIVTATYRPEMLGRCVENFRAQTWPNKELILVLNSDELELPTIPGVGSGAEDIKVLRTPREQFTGGCLNLGIAASTGAYWFKLDDDDYYGPNYIRDLVLHARSVDADVIGKPPSFLHFDDDGCTYFLHTRMSDMIRLNEVDIAAARVWLSGNTIAGTRKIFDKARYQERNLGAADLAFVVDAAGRGATVVCGDRLNVVASRRADVSSHTWQIGSDELKKKGEVIAGGIERVTT